MAINGRIATVLQSNSVRMEPAYVGPMRVCPWRLDGGDAAQMARIRRVSGGDEQAVHAVGREQEPRS